MPSMTTISLFNLPVEVTELIFDQIVVSRKIDRVMRIRLVNAQFKYFIDNSIRRLDLLSTIEPHYYFSRYIKPPFPPSPIHTWHVSGTPKTETSPRESIPYVVSYLEDRVLREQPTASSWLGRIRLAAQALDGPDGDLRSLSSLICLAIAENIYHLLWEPTNYFKYDQERDDAGTDADVFVAAAYLGRRDHVARLIADGIPSGPSYRSAVFGTAMNAATIQADMEMIKLLLLRTPQYFDMGYFPDDFLLDMLDKNNAHNQRANTHGREAVFNFVLNTIQTARFQPGNGGAYDRSLRFALQASPSVNGFERAAALLTSPDGDDFPFDRGLALECLLMWHVAGGNVETVRELLDMGVSPNVDFEHFTPLLRAVLDHNDTIVEMLLDDGADPSIQIHGGINPMGKAVWQGRVAMASVLLDYGVDPNCGDPPPILVAVYQEHLEMFQLLRDHGARLDTTWRDMKTGAVAMMLACRHGLSSMQDVLVHEGISQDVLVHEGISQDDIAEIDIFADQFFD